MRENNRKPALKGGKGVLGPMSRADRTEVFEHMPIPRAVGRQIIPAIASQMIALVYNLADTYFVGMLDDPKETAAITVVYSSFVMLTAISNLFGVGGASALSRALGKKDTEAAKGIAALSFWGGLGCAVLFSLLFLLFARPILMLCGAGPEIFDTAYRYALWVVVIGGPGTILNTLLSNLVRAEGKAAAAAAGVSMGGLLNIILDPFFVLPRFLGLGAAGRASPRPFPTWLQPCFPGFYCLEPEKDSGQYQSVQAAVRGSVYQSHSRQWLSFGCAVRAYRGGDCSPVQIRLTVYDRGGGGSGNREEA